MGGEGSSVRRIGARAPWKESVCGFNCASCAVSMSRRLPFSMSLGGGRGARAQELAGACLVRTSLVGR